MKSLSAMIVLVVGLLPLAPHCIFVDAQLRPVHHLLRNRCLRLSLAVVAVCVLTLTLLTGPSLAQNSAPRVESVALTSDPGPDGGYGIGNRIEVAITFDVEVVVTGSPEVSLDIGASRRTAPYSGTRGRQLLFGYTVVSGDVDDDGIELVANSLALNGGSILAAVGSDPAALGHTALRPPVHLLVDGIAPTVRISSHQEFVQLENFFLVLLIFSEPVYGLTAADLTVTNGTALDPQVLPATAQYAESTRWDVIVVPVAGGPITVDLSADAVIDAYGNGNLRADSALTVIVANPPRVNISTTTSSVIEGGSANFTLTRTGGAAGALNVRIRITQSGSYLASGATASLSRASDTSNPLTSEITSTPFQWTLSFEADENSKTLSIPTTDNIVDELDGSISVEVDEIPGSYGFVAGRLPKATAVVHDNDDPDEVSVQWYTGWNAPSVAEGEAAVFSISRSDSRGALAVKAQLTSVGGYLDISGGSTVEANYALESDGTDGRILVRIPEGVRFHLIRVSTLEDDIEEDDGSITIQILESDAGYVLDANQATATAVIADDDAPPSLAITPSQGTITEGEAAQFVVNRTGRSALIDTGEVSVDVRLRQVGSYLDDSAVLAGNSPGPVTHQVTLGEGEPSVSFSLATEDDDSAENPGYVTAQLDPSTDDSYEVGSPAIATVTIQDNEPPQVSISAVEDEVTEGTDARFRLTRAGSAAALEVGLYVSGHRKMMSPETKAKASNSEAAGQTFDTTVTLQPGITEATVVLTTQSDNRNEGDGLIGLEIGSSPTGAYSLSDTASAHVLVKDDDIPTISIRRPSAPTGLTLSDSGDTWEGTISEGDPITFGIDCIGDYNYGADRTRLIHYILWIQEMNHPGYYGPEIGELGKLGNNQVFTYAPLSNCTGDETSRGLGRSRRYTGPDGGEVRIFLSPSDNLSPPIFAAMQQQYQQALAAAGGDQSLVTQRGVFPFTPDGFSVRCSDDLRYCPQYRIGAPNAIKIEVLNRDPVILIKANADTVTEGGAATFTIERKWAEDLLNSIVPGYATTEVAVRVTSVGGYVSGTFPTQVSFGRNETSKTLNFPTTDDQLYGASGSVTVELLPDTTGDDENLAGRYSTWRYWDGHTTEGKRSDRATVTVENDDAETQLSVSNAFAYEGDGQIEFEVRLSEVPTSTIELQFATSDVTATAGTDYVARTGTIEFLAGETSKTVAVDITSDGENEGATETLNLTISSAVGITLAGADRVTGVGTIADRPRIDVSAKAPRVLEGDPVVIEFTRTGYLEIPVEIRYRHISSSIVTTGLPPVQVASLAAGANTAEISIATVDDDIENRLRRHVVRLAPTGSQVWRRGANSFAVVDVVDDDSTPVVQVRAKNDEVVEGSPAVFEFSRSRGDLRRGLRLNYRYTDPDGTTVSDDAEFPANGTTVEVSYATTDDADINSASRTHTVSLHGDLHVGGTNIDRVWRAGTPSSATVTVNDNDLREGIHLDVSGPSRFLPGTTLDLEFTVTNLGTVPVQGPINVLVSYDSPVTACTHARDLGTGAHFTCSATPITLTDSQYAALETTGSISFTVTAMTATLTSNMVGLTIPVGGEPILSFTESTVEVREGPNAKAELTVEFSATLTPALMGNVRVAYDIVPLGISPQGTDPAVAGEDYVDTSGTLIFSDSTQETIEITIKQDELDEFREEFSVQLSSPESAMIDPDKSSVTVAILDESGTVVPALTLARRGQGNVDERDGSIKFTARLDRASGKRVLALASDPGTGTATVGEDYSEFDGQMLVIEPGELSATFDVQVYEDDAEEGDETFTVGIALAGSSVGRATLGTPTQHTITLVNHTPSTTITLGAAPQRVNESAGETTVSLTATLDEHSFNTDTTVLIEFGDDSETEDSDFTGLEPFDFVIPAGSTSHTVDRTFTPIDDDLDENPETLYLVGEFTDVDGGESPVTVSRTSVTITDDDTKGVTLTPLTLALVEAGSAMSYRVVLDSEPFGDVTIDSDVEDNDHLVIVPSQLTFTRENWDTEQRVRVSANEDGDTDPTTNATATISHTASGGRYGDVTISNVAVTIAEATPVVDVSNARANEKAGSIEFTASMTASFATESVSITYSTVDGSAIANEDYAPETDATLTFLPGETEKVITITLVDDNVDESNETFSLAVTESSTLVGLAHGATTLTPQAIVGDDDPTPQLAGTPGATAENLIFVSESAGAVVVTLNLDVASSRKPTVDYETVTLTQAGAENAEVFPEATRFDDYAYVTGTATFALGANTATIIIPIVDDQESEETEYFALLLESAYRLRLGDEEHGDEDEEVVAIAFGELPAGVIAGTPPVTNVGIYASVPEVAVSFDAGTYTVAEGEMVAVTVSLDMDPQRQVMVPLTRTEQSGIAGSDYSGLPASVTFESGETSKSFTFSAAEDTTSDGGESVQIGFGTLPVDVTLGATSTTTVSITDVVPVEVSFGAGTYTASEGGTVTVTVTLNGDPERQVVVPLLQALTGGASSSDFSGVPESLTFNSGETSKTFTFSATDDTANDDGEGVDIGFGALPTGVRAGSQSTTIVTISDTDVPDSVAVSFGAGRYSVSQNGTITFKVELDVDPERTVAIPIRTTHLGGTSFADWSGVPRTVTFNSGETSKSFSFVAAATADDGEGVVIRFGTLPVGVAAGTHPTATVTIGPVPAVQVQFTAQAHSVDEGSSVTVTVALDVDPERQLLIHLTATQQNGISEADFSNAPPPMITFESGETSKTFTFVVASDAIDDDGESLEIGFRNLPEGVSQASPSSTTVTIRDVVPVQVSFGTGTFTVPEGNMVTFTVTLNKDPERQVVVPLTATGQGGATASDYSGVPSSVTFLSGETSKTFTFSATDDTADDDGESVGIGFGTQPAGVSTGSVSTTTFTITDDDDPEVKVSFSAAMFGVTEGATVTVTVTLDKDPERQVVVPLTATGLNGATAADYSGIPANVTFESGETSKNFTFIATEGAGFIISVAITDNDEPELVVSPTSLSVQEGEAGSYTLNLATRPTGAVTVEVTGHGETDLMLGTTTFMFDRDTWDTPQTVTFTAGADDDAVNDTVSLAHTVSGADYAGLVTDDVTVTVEDTDTVGVIVSDTTMDITEGEEDEYSVKLRSAPTSDVTIRVTREAGSQVLLRKRSLTFTKETWNVDQAVPVEARSDEDSKNHEESIRHSVRGGEYDRVRADNVLVTITDDDIPVAVSFASSTYTVAEGASVTVTVDLDVEPERQVTIPITATNENGASDGDYSSVPDSVVFESVETSQTFIFAATQDAADDDGEQVRLTFGTLPAGVSAGADSETVVSISDDDVAEVIVSPDTVPVPEGGSGRYSVVLSTVPAGTVTVTVTDPTDNTDVTAEPADLTFTPADWESPQYVTVSAIEDDDFIDDTATVTHTVSGYGSVVTASSVTVAVNDDESAVALVTNLEESLDGSYIFGVNHRVLVTFRTGSHAPGYVFTGLVFDVQTAAPAGMTVSVVLAEYDRVANAQSNRVTLTGEFTATGEVSITPASPVVLSPNQEYIVVIESSYGGALTGSARGQLAATSSDAEDTQPGDTNWAIGDNRSDTDLNDLGSVQVNTQTLRFAVQGRKIDLRAPEGAPTISGNLVVGETLTADTSAIKDGDGLTTVTYAYQWIRVDAEKNETAIGEATQSTYLLANEDAGSTMKVRVTFRDDATNPHQLESVETGIVTVPAVEVSFGQATYTVAEGASVTVTVDLDVDPKRTVTIPITATNEDGATNADYSGVPNSVTFESGDTSQTFAFTATQDAVDDDDEQVKLTFGTLPSEVTAGTTSETVVSITDDDLPDDVKVSFGSPTYTVAEGASVTVTVDLDVEPERQVTIPITATNEDGASNADYSNVPDSVVFESEDTSKTFTFTATDDSDDDDDERVKLTFGTLPNGITAGTTSETVVSITDDDAPDDVKVSFGSATYTAAEGGTVEVTVTLDVEPERQVTILLTATNEGGASDGDYSNVPDSVVFESGDTSQAFTFTATDDSDDDDDERVKLTFGTLPNGITAGTTSETVVSITDDDAPDDVKVSFGSATYTAAEGGTVEVAVTLDVEPERQVTIPITATNENGASDGDYSSVPDSVVFESGETLKTFAFMATQDAADDGGERVRLTFGTLPDGITAGTTSETVVSISDDDVAEVIVSPDTVPVPEGGSGRYSVVLSTVPAGTVTVTVTDPTDNTDVTAEPADLTFTPADWESPQYVTVSAIEDDDFIDDTATVTHTVSGYGSVVTASSVTVAVNDDESAVALVTNLEESLDGSYIFGVNHRVLVTFRTGSHAPGYVFTGLVFDVQTAAPAGMTVSVVLAEYDRVANAQSNRVTLTGEFTATGEVSITPASPVVLSPNQEYIVVIESSYGGALTGSARGQLAATSSDAEDTQPGDTNWAIGDNRSDTDLNDLGSVQVNTQTLRFAVQGRKIDLRAPEGAPTISGNLVVGETLTADTSAIKDGDGLTTVTYAYQWIRVDAEKNETAIGEATQSTYLLANEDAGSTMKVRVTFRDDATNPHQLESVETGIVTVPAVEVSFGQATYTVAEGASVTVTVDLDVDPKRTVTIPITATNEDGATNADYRGVPDSVTFESGDTSQTFAFTATQDAVDDDDEQVKLTFGTLPSGVTAGTTSETVVSITDDDLPDDVKVSFGSPTYTVAEGASVTVTVDLDVEPERQVTIPITATNEDGASNADYSNVPDSVVFESEDTSKTFTFTATDDSDDDDDERVKLTFGTLPNGITAGTTSETVVSITDDDAPDDVKVSFGSATYTAAEGGTVEVTVTLDVEPERQVTILLTATNEGGASDGDYSNVPDSVVFESGDTSQAFTFTATDDSDDDDDERVKLTFGTLPNGITAGTTSETVVSITDDDAPDDVKVSFGSATYTAAEGGTVEVAVTLDVDPERQVTIPLTATNEGGASDGDYSNVPDSVVFESGETLKTFAFMATQDAADDGGERVRLTFGTLPDGITAGTTSETVVSITDDDVAEVIVSPDTVPVPEGGSGRYSVVLSTVPAGTVTVTVTDPTDNTDVTAEPADLTFTPADWESPQYVTVSAIEDDDFIDDTATVTHTVSGYGSVVTASSVTVAVNDDESAVALVTNLEESLDGSYTFGVNHRVLVTFRTGLHAPGYVFTGLVFDVQTATPTGMTVSVVLAEYDRGTSTQSNSMTLTGEFTATGEVSITPASPVVLSRNQWYTVVIESSYGGALTGSARGQLSATSSNAEDTQPGDTNWVIGNNRSDTDLNDLGNVQINTQTLRFAVQGRKIDLRAPEGAPTISGTPMVGETLTADTSAIKDADGLTMVTYAYQWIRVDAEKNETVIGGADQSTYLLTHEDAGSTMKVRVTFRDDATNPHQLESVETGVVTAPGVTVSPTTVTVAEGGTATYQVKLNTLPAGTVTVTINDPADNTDVTADTPSLSFDSTNWDTFQDVTVRAAEDGDADDDTATVTHTVSGYGTVTTADSVSVTVTDNEPTVTVSFGQATYSVSEGGTVTVEVTLSADPERTVVVPITTTNQGGATNGDYMGVPADVTFNSGDTSMTFEITATDDSAVDGGESIKLGFGTLPAKVTEGSPDETTVSITDNDVAGVTVNPTTVTVAEGETATYQVKLNTLPAGTVTVTINDPADNTDVTADTPSLSFDSTNWDTFQDVTVRAAEDGDADDDTATVTHTVSGYGTVTTADSVSVTVTDNEPAVEVSFGQSTYTVVEGGTVTVTVGLDVDPERTVVIPITTTNQGGATNGDYMGVPADVTFNSGDTSMTFEITATDDSAVDGGESIKLGFGTLPAKVTEGSPDETTVSITDNDVAGVTVNPTTVTVAEGETATYQVKLNTLPAGTVTVTINDPADNTDVTADTPSLSFDSTNWDTFQDVTVRAAEDGDADDDTATVTHTVSGYGTVTTADSVSVTVTDNEPAVEVSFGQSTYTVVEGGTVTVTVGLDVDPERTVVIPITTTNQGGATNGDYMGVPADVTFNSGDTSMTFEITATDDSAVDGGESIKLGFGTLPAKVSAASPDETTVSITDNDVAGVTVNPTTVTVAEGETATYQVKLNTLPAGAVTVTINDPADNTDVTAVTASLSFDSTNWSTFQDVTVRAAEDGDAEDDTATVTHTVSGYGTVTTADSVSVTVTDNEPAVEVSFGQATYTVAEGGTVTVAVTLDVDPERTVVVPITVTDQGGATNGDYMGVPADVTFNSGDTSMTFEITATDDSAVDGGESIKLGFGTLPAKVTEGSPDETTVSITDNDVAGVTVNPTTVTVAEGETATYQVKLNTLPAGAVTVTINDPADNTDVTADTPSLSFDSTNWDTFQDVTVRAAEDGDAEDDTATVTHTVSGYGTVTTADSVSVTVTDNEPAVEVSFGQATYTVAEGGTVTVAVTLDVDPERTVVVPITVTDQGGATNGDYMGVPADVTFNSGDTSMTFEITATDDSAVDGGESVKLGFGALPAKVSAASPDETTVSITDNDVAGVTVSPTTVTVAEGGTATYQVKLNTLPAGTVTVTINDPADNTDVTADTPSLSFDSTNWDTFQDVTVRAAEDGDADDDTATVTHTVSGYGTVTTADSVSVTVTDNEPAVTVSFGQATYSVSEGGTVTVEVTLSADPERTVVVPITVTDQGGATGGDYMGVPADVTFNSGDTSMTFEITATDDSAVDGGESIKLGFGALPAKVSAASPDETTVSITDNDVAGVTVSPTTVTVAEGGTATYQVKLNTLPAGTVTVTINDPTDNTDVTAVTASLSFDSTNWDTFQDVTVRAAEDGDAEDDTATVTHTVSGYGTVTTADSVSVTVTDNEPAVEVSFGQATYTVAEGGTVTVAVTLDVDPERTVVVPITVTDQGGATNGDYMGVPADVTFNSGDTSMTFEITATDDSAVDGGESVKLGFGALPAKVSAASPDETTVSITDNDVAGVTVSPTTVTVAEGGTATYQVKLNTLPTGTVTVTINDPTDNTDVTAVTASLSFDSTNWSTFQDVTVRAAEDGDAEDDTATVTHTVSGYGTVTTADSVSVTVTDNEPAVEVSFGQATYTVAEGGTVTVAVTLDVDPERTVVVPITVTDQGGATGGDYMGVPADVTFNSGDTSMTFEITATDDSAVDGGESVKLGFGALPAKVSAASPDETTVSITDNDGVGVRETTGQNQVCTKGEITVRGQTDRWIWRITDSDYWDEYTIDLMGLHSNNGTLRDPHIVYIAKIYTHDGFYPPAGSASGGFPSYGSNDGGVGWDSSSRISFRIRTGSYSYFPGKEPELDTGYYTALVGANPFGDGANGLGSYTLCIEGPGSISAVDQPERRIVVSAAHVDVSDGEPAQFSIKLGARPTGPVEVFMTKLEPASDSQYVVEPLLHSFTVDNWDIPQVATVRRKADYVTPKDDGFAIHYWGKGGGYHKEFEFIEVYDRVPRWMTLRSTVDPEPDLTDQVAEAQKQNSPATGGPGIQGVARAGETLTATTSGIRDDDGLDNAVFAYQWVRSELGAESGTDIAGATGSSYGVTAEDEGRAITVRVTFTDDAGNEESVISYAVVAAAALPQTRAPDPPGAPDVSPHDGTSLAVSWTAPASDGGSAVTGYKVQWKEAADSWDTPADVSEAAATGTSHRITGLTDGTEYSVRVLAINDVGEGLPSDDGSGTPRETVPPELSGASVDGATLTLTFNEALDEDSKPATTAFTVTVGGNVRAVDYVDVIGGAVTLTLASAVTSQDTVTVSYAVPASESAERLRDAVGNAAASFTDESVTNDTGPAPPLTASVHDAPESHNGTDAFTFELRFSETPRRGFSYETLRDHAFTATGGEVLRARRLEPGKNVRWEITVRPDSNGAVTIVLPATEDCAADGAICTGDGRMLSERVELTVSGPGG